MESSSPEISKAGARRPGGHGAGSRRPFIARKRFERQLARGRIAVRTRRPLAPAQVAFDPLTRPNRTSAHRRVRFLIAILGSLAVHVTAVSVGFVWRSQISESARQEVRIEVRQRPPEPTPEKKPPPPPPPIEKPTRAPPKIAKAPPPPLPTPPIDVPKPVRVIGLNLESTTEGGSGPTFAVGNTRLGETAKRAVAPRDIPVAPSGPPAPAVSGPGRSNQAASRIPVAGMKYELPKRRRPKNPPFPETLKAQGIEGDVLVMVAIDATGKVTDVKVLKASPYGEFNEAARAAALAEEFDPATKDGVPMSSSISYSYRFRLEDK